MKEKKCPVMLYTVGSEIALENFVESLKLALSLSILSCTAQTMYIITFLSSEGSVLFH